MNWWDAAGMSAIFAVIGLMLAVLTTAGAGPLTTDPPARIVRFLLWLALGAGLAATAFALCGIVAWAVSL